MTHTRDPYAFCATEPEDFPIACDICGRVLPGCSCSQREAAGRQHLIVRDQPSHIPQTLLTHGDLIARIEELRAERDLHREDLRRVAERIEVLMTHARNWSTEYVAQCLREMYAQVREALG